MALSESELIGAMERHRIGTDASIPSHIGTIESRKYARLLTGGGGRRFEPTALGVALIQGLRHVDAELVTPSLRAHMERQLERIASGDASRAHVVAECLDAFESKFQHLA